MTTPRDSRLPAARISDLILTETGTDVLVYDETAKSIHTLNEVTVKVWRALDGTKTASIVATETGLNEEIVLVAVSRLSDVSLLEGDFAPADLTRNSRRAMVKKMGIAASVPVIMSVTAPLASAQNSAPTCQSIFGDPCIVDSDCGCRCGTIVQVGLCTAGLCVNVCAG